MMSKRSPKIVKGPYRVVVGDVYIPNRPMDTLTIQDFTEEGTCSKLIAVSAGDVRGLLRQLQECIGQFHGRYSHAPGLVSEAGAVQLIIGRLAASVKAGQTEVAAIRGIELGLRLQWLLLSPYDSDTSRGRTVLRGGRKGHTRAYGTDQQKQEDRDEILRALYVLEAEEPDLGKGELDKRVAHQFGISDRTVRRARRKKKN